MSVNTSNVINKNVHNESAALAEVGYNFSNKYLSLQANVYWIEWINKTMTKSGILKDNENYDTTFYDFGDGISVSKKR